MRFLTMSAALAVALHFTAASAEGAANAWQPGDLTLREALDAGFAIVDTYHNHEGHLFFVLQHQNRLMLCQFEEIQAHKCLRFGDR